MSSTCTSLKSLEFDSEAAGHIAASSPTLMRKQLLAQLLVVTADANTLLSTTSHVLPGIPQGANIAALLHRGAVTVSEALVAEQALVRRVDGSELAGRATALTARLSDESVGLGTTFVHLGGRYPSAQLDATMDQTPTCALVHA
jgi:hypothetical protein